jgi:endonuclease III
VQHGEEICLLKSPRCGECPVVALCGFKRKVGVVGKS